MDGNINEKLNNFNAKILSDAQKRRAELEMENQNIKKKKIDKAQDEFLNNAYHIIQASIGSIKKSDNEKILTAEVNAKRELLLKREEMINNIFERVNARLADFMTGDEYKQWLGKKVEKAYSQAGNGEKTIYARAEDLAYVEEFVKKLDDKEGITVLTAGDKELFGGIKLKNNVKNILIDYSFDDMTAAAKSEFLQKSGMVIN